MDNSATRAAIAVCMQAGVPVLIWGSPGEGKSSVVESLAESLEMRVEVVIGSVRDATDFAGLPMRSDDGVVFAPPAWARRCLDGTPTVVFLDEINTAPPSTQAAMMRVVLDREVGDLVLPPSVAIVAAANPVDISAGADELAAPLANRFLHLDWEASPTSWIEGFRSGWRAGGEVEVVPGDLGVHAATWRGRVAAFIDHFPDRLRQVPDDYVDRGRAWPSPRTWDLCHQVCAAASAAGAGPAVRLLLASGAVGEAAALELLAFVEDEEAVDADAVLDDPDRWAAEERDDVVLALLSAVCSRVERADEPALWSAAWRVVARVIDTGRPDLAVLTARSLVELRRPTWEQPDLTKIKQHLESLGYLLVDDRLDEWWM